MWQGHCDLVTWRSCPKPLAPSSNGLWGGLSFGDRNCQHGLHASYCAKFRDGTVGRPRESLCSRGTLCEVHLVA